MNRETVAQRYAQALFDIGKEHGPQLLESYKNNLTTIGAAHENSTELTYLFSSPVVTNLEKKALVTEILRKYQIDQTIINFCLVLIEHNRIPLIKNIIKAFEQRFDEYNNIVRLQVTTAIPLTSLQEENIATTLKEQTKKTLLLTFTVHPEILGGIVLQMGDKVFDGSLRSQLTNLKDIIKGE